MAGVSKDRSLDFKGFLKDLKDFDLSDGKDRKMKSQAANSKKLGPMWNYDQLPFSLSSGEKMPDASSEKELGNEYFKQKKYNEAIECYSRSIALSPTAVAFANRAMAYIKIKGFLDAENDCTEALNLDDRYIKAYSRRATARKELGKYKDAMEDLDFAVRLEPNNQEIRKQYTEAKELLEKEIAKNKSGPSLKIDGQGMKRVQNVPSTPNKRDANGKASSNNPLISVKDMTGTSTRGSLNGTHGNTSSNSTNQSVKDAYVKASSSNPLISVKDMTGTSTRGSLNGTHGDTSLNFTNQSAKIRKQDQDVSIQDLASRAASRVMANAKKNISAPKSAYEFEVAWRSLSSDPGNQAYLLKIIQPTSLPQIFKNALSAPMLIEIIKCTATIFMEDTEFAVSILDNLIKVPRFDMIIMCLSAVDHAEIHRLWQQVFSKKDVRADHVETLSRLRSKFCYGDRQYHELESSIWQK